MRVLLAAVSVATRFLVLLVIVLKLLLGAYIKLLLVWH